MQEREAALALSLQDLRSAMNDLADEAADKEDALRRQVCGLCVGCSPDYRIVDECGVRSED